MTILTREKQDLEDNTESLFPFFPFQDSPSFPVNPSSISFPPPHIYKNWFTVYTFIFLFMLPHYFCLYSPLLFTSITDSKTNNVLVSPSFPLSVSVSFFPVFFPCICVLLFMMFIYVVFMSVCCQVGLLSLLCFSFSKEILVSSFIYVILALFSHKQI